MSRNESDLGELRAAEGPEMIAAMRLGVIEALGEHRREGRSIIAWDRKTCQIIEIPPGDLADLGEPSEVVPISSQSQSSA